MARARINGGNKYSGNSGNRWKWWKQVETISGRPRWVGVGKHPLQEGQSCEDEVDRSLLV